MIDEKQNVCFSYTTIYNLYRWEMYLIGVRSKLLYYMYILFADSKHMRSDNEDFNWRSPLK